MDFMQSIFDCPGGEIGKARQLRSKETTLCIIRPICNDMQSTKTHLSHRAARRRRAPAAVYVPPVRPPIMYNSI